MPRKVIDDKLHRQWREASRRYYEKKKAERMMKEVSPPSPLMIDIYALLMEEDRKKDNREG